MIKSSKSQAKSGNKGIEEGRPRRQKRGERTRELILDAVLSLLAEGGAAAVSHRAVARQAGVSLGATTYYFGSKREMLAAAFELHLGRTRIAAEALLASAQTSRGGTVSPPQSGELAAGLAGLLGRRVGSERDRYLASLEVMLERARDPALRDQLAGPSAASDALAVAALTQLGTTRPEQDAHLLIATLQGLSIQWLTQGEDSDFAERVPSLTRRLVEMLSAPSD